MKKLYETSYVGNIWDPIIRPDLEEGENYNHLISAFRSVIEYIEDDKK